MIKSRSPLAIIFVTVLIDLIGFGIVIPVLPLYAERFGASPTVIGLLLGIFSAMQFIFSPLLGRLSDRVGRRPVLLLSLIGTAIGFFVMGLAGSLWLLFVARIIDGISGANISTAQAYIADVTPPAERSRSMGLIGAAFGLGFIIGPALGGVLSHVSLAAPFFFAAALAACNAVALYFFLPESLTAEHRSQAGERPSLAQIFREAGNWQLEAVMATYFFATVAFAMLTATYPLFASKRFGYDATHVGYIFAYVGFLGAAIQGGLIGRLVKMFGEKTLAVAGTGLMSVSLLALPAGSTLLAMLAATTGISIGNSLATPTLNGLASKSAPAAFQGRVFGALQSVASLARIVGPPLGGWLLEHNFLSRDAPYGELTYWTGAVLMLIAMGLALTLSAKVEYAGDGAMRLEGQEREGS